jgi:hypothetical protein
VYRQTQAKRLSSERDEKQDCQHRLIAQINGR